MVYGMSSKYLHTINTHGSDASDTFSHSNELTNEIDIIVINETWEHDAQRIQGFDK